MADVSAANLSRTERGLPGGVHPRHLERIAGVFGTSVVALYTLAEAVAETPELLDHPAEVAALTDRLAELQRAYLRAPQDRRDEVDQLLDL